MRLHRALFLSIFGLTLASAVAPPASATTIQYAVTVNTSSASATDGYIDFQFNPGGFGSQPANADVSAFVTDGVLNPADPGNGTVGEASGTLPGTVSLINSETTNEYTEAMTFGSTITFNLDLSGPAIDNPNGAGGGTFTLDFLNSDQSAYLFTADDQNDVPVLTVDINGDGSTTATTYASTAGGPPVVTFSGPTTVPEPASWLLLAAGLLAVGVVGRRKQKRARALR